MGCTGRWKHGPKFTVPWWFHFDPHPNLTKAVLVAAKQHQARASQSAKAQAIERMAPLAKHIAKQEMRQGQKNSRHDHPLKAASFKA